jgi:hypothetical protein
MTKNNLQHVEFLRGGNNIEELNFYIQNDHSKKETNSVFKVGGEYVQFPQTKTALSQLNARTKALKEWTKDPFNPKNGNDGHAFSMMMGAILSQVYLTQGEELIAIPSPATVHFIENNHSREWGPSGDIIIGEIGGNCIVPRLLISSHMSDKDRQAPPRNMNSKLNVPVYHLYGNTFFDDGGLTVFNFGSANSPQSHIDVLSQRHGPYLRQVIGSAMSV